MVATRRSISLRTALAAGAATVLVLLSGCSSSDDDGSGGDSAASSDRGVIGAAEAPPAEAADGVAQLSSESEAGGRDASAGPRSSSSR